MTRRRTDNRHRGDARGLARRRSNPDAARPQAENRTGTPSGSAPRSPRTATSLWFRITSEAVRRMREQTPAGPAATAWSTVLLAWMPPDHPLDPDLNRFHVWVSDDGDTRIERYGD